MAVQDYSQNYKLYRRKGGARWYMRFSIKGQGQQRISLGTCDKAEADYLAQAQWHKSRALAEAGLSVTRKSFDMIAREFIESIRLAVHRGDKAEYHARQYPPIVSNYFIGFFAGKQMNAIKAADIENYWDWRRDYWITGPGSKNPYIRYDRIINGRKTSVRRPVKEGVPSESTLRKEALLLKQLFEFGKRRGYTLDIPDIEVPKSNKRGTKSRPGFTLVEFLHLMEVSEARVKQFELGGDDPSGKNQRVYSDRMKLHCFCMIAGFTGMRPTELFNLSWGDLDKRSVKLEKGLSHDVVVIQARGKGKERELAAMPETLKFFDILQNLFILTTGQSPTDIDPVFFNHQGERVRSFKKGLAELLIAADLRQSRDGRLRDSFSFRHFYITQQIREGVGHHILSRNTGTSTKMIDAYYSKIRPTDEIGQLIPDWLKRRPFKYEDSRRAK